MKHARICLIALLLALPGFARAETYRIDLIVFLDKFATGELGRRAAQVDTTAAIDPANAGALSAHGIALLPEDQFALTEQWQRLRSSKRWQPLIKMAWTQKDPPAERGPALRVRFGQSFSAGDPERGSEFSVYPVEGSVALLLKQYLQLDADLVYTLPGSGSVTAYRLKERRRMRRDEMHHLDSPKLGILTRVTKSP